MTKNSLKNKTLSFALALSLVVSLNVPFAAFADEGNSDLKEETQQEQVNPSQDPSSNDAQSQEEADTIALYSNDSNNISAVQDANTAVAEVNDVTYASAQEAIDANNNATVTLLADTAEDVTIPAGKTITLNLNSKTLTNKSTDTITVNLGGTLTVNGDGTVDNVTNGKACIYNNGTANLNGGTYTRSKEAENSPNSGGGNSYYNLLNHGNMTITDSKIISSGAFSSLIASGYYNYTDKKAGERSAYLEGVGQAEPRLTINNGYFTGGINTIKNDDGGSCVINDGTFENMTQHAVFNGNHLIINGGTFNPGKNIEIVVYNWDNYDEFPNDCTVDINGGTFYGNIKAGHKLTVTQGSFNGTIKGSATSLVDLTGGIYTENPNSFYVHEGYTSIPLDDDPAELYSIEKIAAGDTTVAVVVPPSELEPALSDSTKDALVDSAKKAAEDISNGKTPSNVAISDEDAQKIKEATASKGENDSVSVKLIVNAVPVYESEDSPINSAKSSNEEVTQWVDLSIDMVVSVVDANGNTKSSATTKVNELNDQVTVTITVEPESIQGKNVRIARNHDGVVDFIEPTVNYETGEITFTTDRFSEYAVLTSDKAVEPGANSGGNPTPGNSTATTTVNTEKTSSAKTGDNLGLFAGVAAVAAVVAVALGGFALRRKHD